MGNISSGHDYLEINANCEERFYVNMVYVDSQGTVHDRRSIWTPSGFYHCIVSFFQVFILFIRSLIDPTLTKNGSNTDTGNYRVGRWGGGGGGGRFDQPPDGRPRRRMGGFGGTGGGPSCPPMAGG